MSMPGFNFHFHCRTCDASSHDYSVYPFPDVFVPDIVLPTWSLQLNCWGEIRFSLTPEQRAALESDPATLASFAASVSTDSFVVAVPHLATDLESRSGVTVTPAPICPQCNSRCGVIGPRH